MKYTIDKSLIYNYLKDNNLSKYAFCKKCKIAVSTFNSIVEGGDISLTVVLKVARAMDKHLNELIG